MSFIPSLLSSAVVPHTPERSTRRTEIQLDESLEKIQAQQTCPFVHARQNQRVAKGVKGKTPLHCGGRRDSDWNFFRGMKHKSGARSTGEIQFDRRLASSRKTCDSRLVAFAGMKRHGRLI